MQNSANNRMPECHAANAAILACDRMKKPSFLASGMLRLIKFYQRYISSGNPGCCRFDPTCSSYAAEAIRRHGAFKGGGMAVWRILRCNPFCKGGYDPVPEKKSCYSSACLNHQCFDEDSRKVRKEAT